MPDLVTAPLMQLDPMVRSGAAILILCVLLAAAFYVVSSFRDYVAGDQEATSDELANLREMHLRGDITDEEFRTIQSHTQQLRSDEVDDRSGSDDATASTDQDSLTHPSD